MLADRFPKADVATSLQPVPAEDQAALLTEVSSASQTSELACESAETGTPSVDPHIGLNTSEHFFAPGPAVPSLAPKVEHREVPLPVQSRIAPLGAGRYELRTMVDQETHDMLRQLQALLAHTVPSGDVPELLKRALKLAVQDAERRRYAATSRVGTRRRSKNPRHIPADVRRAVHERDGEQCTFVSATGHRCAETRLLEYDHVRPVARGGQATVENTRLRCRAHNQYEAERTYGAGFMREKRQAAKARPETARMLRGAAVERARMRDRAASPAHPRAQGVVTAGIVTTARAVHPRVGEIAPPSTETRQG
jgi:5-methylcytosine-specific restriction endonuclease McrA